MANAQIGGINGVPACSVGNGSDNRSNFNGTTGLPSLGIDMDAADTIATLRTRLAAIDGTFYTATRLNIMTYNDMVYALRLSDFTNTIKQ